jgi:cell shape-determining protein MreD
MGGNYSWTQLIILSLLADLFGHWYLGSHLLAITILSIFSSKFTSFYRVSNWLPRTIMANIFFSILLLIIYLIDVIVGKVFTSFSSLVFEVIVLMPLIQFILQKFVNLRPSDIIFYD